MGFVLPRTPDAGADKIKAIHFRVTFDPGVLVNGAYGSGSGQSILVSQFRIFVMKDPAVPSSRQPPTVFFRWPKQM